MKKLPESPLNEEHTDLLTIDFNFKISFDDAILELARCAGILLKAKAGEIVTKQKLATESFKLHKEQSLSKEKMTRKMIQQSEKTLSKASKDSSKLADTSKKTTS